VGVFGGAKRPQLPQRRGFGLMCSYGMSLVIAHKVGLDPYQAM
jgi:hypothetical protein